MNNYYPGQRVVLSAEFRNTAGALFDPSYVRWRWRTPASAVYSAVYGTDAAAVRVATGQYYCTVDIPSASAATIYGTWLYNTNGTGSNVWIASAGRFGVINDGFT